MLFNNNNNNFEIAIRIKLLYLTKAFEDDLLAYINMLSFFF